MKTAITFLAISILIVGVAYGLKIATHGETKLDASLIQTEPVQIVMNESFVVSVDEWLRTEFPTGKIKGGRPPFQLIAAGLPLGMDSYLDGERGIAFSGIPKEAGEYDVSVSAISKNGDSIITKIQMTIEPPVLGAEALLKERADWLNKEVEPTYEAIRSYEGFSTLMNWASQQ